MNEYKYLLDVILGAVVCKALLMILEWYADCHDFSARQRIAGTLLCCFVGIPLALGIGWVIGIVNL